MKIHFPPETPKQCPCGHKHVSWSKGDDKVYCWDCNKQYSATECFHPQVGVTSAKPEEEA